MDENVKWSVTQFCPVCYKNGEIKSVFLNEEDRSLNCVIHGVVGYEDTSVAKYTTVDMNKPMENNNVVIEPEIEEIEDVEEEHESKEELQEIEPKVEKENIIEKKFDFFRKE